MKLKSPMLLVSILSAILLAAASANEERPNIVFLLTDDQSFWTLASYGNPDVKTPNIDALASEGLVFDSHYDTTAICMASRATIMTGMFEYKTGCNFEHGDLVRKHWEKSYPMLLREAGYQTAIAGKVGFEVTDVPETKGALPEDDFDRWGGGPGQTSYDTKKNKSMAAYAEEYPHSSRSYGAFSRDFIRDAARGDTPFCLSISFKAPHKPDTPDPLDNDVYAGVTFQKPENYGREAGAHFSKQSKQGRQWERFHSWGYADDYDNVMRRYHQQIYAVDVAVGMIREALDEADVAENTVVIFTSDNGFFCGAHGYGSKVLPYEDSSRVPLIIKDPRNANAGKGLRTSALTGNVDFAPTILELAGLPIPENMDGKSLLHLLDDPEADHHDVMPLINVWGPKEVHSFGVVTPEMKYVFWNYGGKGFTPVEELYHLDRDPFEMEELSGNPEYKSQLETMRANYDAALDHWKKEAVPYHNYQPFGVTFDREMTWEEKMAQ